MSFRKGAFRAVLLATLALAPFAARAQSDQQITVDRAIKTVGDLTHDKAFGNAHQLLGRARAVLIVPKLFKGGFIVGGEGGTGVLLAREPGGRWSDPAFYAIGSASLGFQAGLEQSEMVLLIMTQKGLDAILRDQFKVGAQAGIAVANLGSGVEGAVSAGGPDIVVWSSSSGVYAGVALNGSIIRSQPQDDARYYGRPVSTRDILYHHIAVAPRAHALQAELATIS
ncbi:MAG TPA: lipid-binding SYLF domain-containing protein [Acetobacteraceae bacterium]|nr:lipid-binding SYLF domain-containing protein [Acetobacteraceae bacterium]